MKKFAFLLALIAVFAMSAVAFAGDGTVTLIAGDPVKISGDMTKGYEGTIWYLGKTSPVSTDLYEVELTATIDDRDGGTTNDVISSDSVAKGDYAGTITVAKSSVLADDASTGVLKVTFANISFDQIPADGIKIPAVGIYAAADTAPKGTSSADVTLMASPATFTGVEDNDQIAYVGLGLEKSFDVVDESGNILYVTAASQLTISSDIKAADQAKIDVQLGKRGDNEATVSLDVAADAPEGVYTVQLLAADSANIAISDDSTSYPIEGTIYENDIVASFTITVEKTADEKVQEAIDNASAAVKDELAQLAGGPVALVMNEAGDTIVSVDLQEIAFEESYNNSVTITVVSLDMESTTSSIDIVPAYLGDVDKLAANVTRDDDNSTGFKLPAEQAADGVSSVITYTIRSSLFEPVLRSAPEGYHDVPVYYTIDFPSAVGIEPISVVYTEYHENANSSSSGACSMGFGLAAIAGLAALVLKKRG